MELIRKRQMYEGSLVSTEKYEGTYTSISKKLYYANRLQLTANPYIQPIYAYSMVEKTPYQWTLTLITDKKYKRLSELRGNPKLSSGKQKIELLVKIARGLWVLHKNL